MAPVEEAYRVIVTSADQKSCIVEVELYKNARSGLYALFELTLANSPSGSVGENLPVLRSQLENGKLSTTTIPRDVTNIKEWIMELFADAFGSDSKITILRAA